MRCEDLLHDIDNALRRQAVKTFPLDPLRLPVVIDHNEIGLCHAVRTSPSQVSHKDETGVKKSSLSVGTGRNFAQVTHLKSICSIIVDIPGHHTQMYALW